MGRFVPGRGHEPGGSSGRAAILALGADRGSYVPQGLKPPSILRLDGTAESRALPQTVANRSFSANSEAVP